MWTIQEVTLSLFDRVVLCCGSLIVPWHRLVLAADFLVAEKYRWGRLGEAMNLLKQLSIYLMAMRYTGAKEILDDNPGDLYNEPLVFSILINAREKSSTDPKDKIFALHGVLDELEVPFPAPDYRKPVEDIYRDSVIACINYDKNLYVLYHVPSDHRRDDLASWVPDWSDAGWKDSDPRYGLLRSRFAACGPANSRWRFSADQNQLIITGTIVDSIIYRAEPLTVIDNMLRYPRDGTLNHRMQDPAVIEDFFRFSHSTYSVLRTWVEVSQWSDYPTGESTKEALQRTLVNDNSKSLADPAKGRAFDFWYNLMAAGELEVMEMVFKKSQPGRPLPALPAQREIFLREWIEQIPEVQRAFKALISALATRFHFDAVAFSHKKCFFHTENGYFGTAPDPLPMPVEAGDKIAVVGGLEMPLLLRPVEGGYRLLTHVYVHGIMHGEAWPEREEALEDIVLI